mgnify:CR=1 FL=1|jgi:hypothetical protein
MTLDTVLYDEEAAGKYIGGAASPISTRTMQRWRLEGIGPVYVKLGRLVRYRQSDLEAFLEAGACKSTSSGAIAPAQIGLEERRCG